MNDELSVINIIDGFLDDGKVFVAFVNVILLSTLLISQSLVNVTLYNIFSWITVVIMAIDVILMIVDVLSGFWEGSVFGSIRSIVINIVLVVLSVWITNKTVQYTEVQLPLLYVIAIGITVFWILSLILSTITQFKIGVLIENIRLLAVFAIAIVGMYGLLGANFGASVQSFFDKASSASLYILGGVVLLDIVLCVIDFIAGLREGLGFGDIITLVLNLIVFGAAVLGYLFAEQLSAHFSSSIGIDLNLSPEGASVFVAFIVYVAVDLLLAIPINLISKTGDLIDSR